MADSRSLQLSADELRRLTKWPDSVIYEFLSLQSGVQEITQNISIVVSQIDQVVTLEAHTENVMNRVVRDQAVVANQISALDAIPSKVASMKRDLARVVTATSQLSSALQSLVAKVAGNKRDQMRAINAIVEQFAALQAQNGRLTAKIAKQADMLCDMREEMAGS